MKTFLLRSFPTTELAFSKCYVLKPRPFFLQIPALFFRPPAFSSLRLFACLLFGLVIFPTVLCLFSPLYFHSFFSLSLSFSYTISTQFQLTILASFVSLQLLHVYNLAGGWHEHCLCVVPSVQRAKN